jgi:hypothetical protein
MLLSTDKSHAGAAEWEMAWPVMLDVVFGQHSAPIIRYAGKSA